MNSELTPAGATYYPHSSNERIQCNLYEAVSAPDEVELVRDYISEPSVPIRPST